MFKTIKLPLKVGFEVFRIEGEMKLLLESFKEKLFSFEVVRFFEEGKVLLFYLGSVLFILSLITIENAHI